MASSGKDSIDKWFLYDTTKDLKFHDLVCVTAYEDGHYMLTLYEHGGEIFKNIPLPAKYFEPYALAISLEEAMIEKLKRT